MPTHKKHATFAGKVVMLGFGSIGKAALPLIRRHLGLKSPVTIISRSEDKTGIARKLGAAFVAQPLNEGNLETVLDAHVAEGDFLLNVAVEVDALTLMRYCWRRGALYLDTCIEPWPGRTEDPALPLTRRSNYGLREEVLAFRLDKRDGPTAVVTMGANPGMASIFVKQALVNMARDNEIEHDRPACHEDWATLAEKLAIRTIHIAERDTQIGSRRKRRGEFVNTWSINGFIGEGLQPCELGWGTHERHFPADGLRHGYGSDAAIMLDRPGAATMVRSWTPLEGPYHGFLITHAESISIADHLTLRDRNGAVTYRPTVHYAYHPCDDAVLSMHEVAGKHWNLQKDERILRDEIEEGMDELGVLLLGNKKGAYWYGSRLSIGEARKLAPYNTATSLQVVAGILAGMVWAMRNPRAGVVEPDDLDHEMVMEIAAPYLGEMVGEYGDWTPLRERSTLFSLDIDAEDPWQFKNFRVT
jgi:homospermidine synthase